MRKINHFSIIHPHIIFCKVKYIATASKACFCQICQSQSQEGKTFYTALPHQVNQYTKKAAPIKLIRTGLYLVKFKSYRRPCCGR